VVVPRRVADVGARCRAGRGELVAVELVLFRRYNIGEGVS